MGSAGLPPWLAFTLALGLFVVSFSLVHTVFILSLLLCDDGRFARRTIGWSARQFFRMTSALGVIVVDASALHKRDEFETGITIANHPSLVDAVMLLSVQPEFIIVMKSSIGGFSPWSLGARAAGFISNNNSTALIKQAAKRLEEGCPLLVFPEGTRTRTPPVNAFKGGFSLIAKKSQAAINTVLIKTDSPYLGKGWPIWRMPELPVVYKLEHGRQFHVTRDDDVKQAVQRIEEYYGKEIGE